MPIDLHPDIIRAIRTEVGGTRLGRRYDRWARRRYGVSGATLAGKTVAGEFGGRSTRTGRGVVSSAGARGPAQFIRSTRDLYKQRYGIDPWAGDRQAIQGMIRHHLNTGVEGYNPGMPTYKDYILGQKLNRQDRRALRAQDGSVGGRETVSFRGPQRTEVGLQSYTIPGQSFEDERRSARLGLLLKGDIDMDDLLRYKQEVSSLKDIPARKVAGDLVVKRQGGQKFKVPARAATGGKNIGKTGELYEVFYDPLGKYFDAGVVKPGAIGNHDSHVHVAGDKPLVRSLGNLARKLGLHVGENSMFGGATPTSGHAPGSFHYTDRAIDVSGGTPAARRKFARIAMREASRRARKR